MEINNIKYLADRLIIEDVITSYATASDSLDVERYAQVFSDDAQILLPDGRVLANGRHEIVETAKKNQTRFKANGSDRSFMRHIVNNLEVVIDDDSAQGNYYMMTVAFNVDANKPEILSLARYEDQLVKRGDRWQVRCRTMHYEWGNDEMARKLKIGPYSNK